MRIPSEALIFAAGIIVLAAIDPGAGHISICPFKLAGIEWCPGCGLGRSISYLLHGDIGESFRSHFLGIPVLAVLLHRIYYLTRRRSSIPGSHTLS